MRDGLLNGGILALGRSGSGKTVSLIELALAMVRHRNSSGLILGAKPEDLGMWRKIFKKAGRKRDLWVYGPGSDLKINFLAEVMRQGGDTREITRCIMTIAETLRGGNRGGRGENAEFFKAEEERQIYNAVEVIKFAKGTVTSADLHSFITTAALSAEQLKSPAWQAGFHCRMLQAAFEAKKTAIEAHDFGNAQAYWLGEFPNQADRTRSSILTGVMGILFIFNSGIVKELASSETNFNLSDVLKRRKWLFVDASPTQYGDSGRFLNAGAKYLVQRLVLRRKARKSDAFNVIWVDECQQAANSGDADYLAQARSHLGCLVYITQSLHSIYTAMGGESGKYEAEALLANFSHKMFFALGDSQSAEWASKHLGNRLETLIGGSVPPQQDMYDAVMGSNQFTGKLFHSLRAGDPAGCVHDRPAHRGQGKPLFL